MYAGKILMLQIEAYRSSTTTITTITKCHRRCHHHHHHSTKFTMITSSYHCHFFGLATLSLQSLPTVKRGALYALLSYFLWARILVDLFRGTPYVLQIDTMESGGVKIFSYVKFKSNWTMNLVIHVQWKSISMPNRKQTKNHWNLSFVLCSVSTHLRE